MFLFHDYERKHNHYHDKTHVYSAESSNGYFSCNLKEPAAKPDCAFARQVADPKSASDGILSASPGSIYVINLPHANEHLKRIMGTLMNAYVISYRMYDAIIDHLKRIEDAEVTELKPVDVEVAMLHQGHQ